MAMTKDSTVAAENAVKHTAGPWSVNDERGEGLDRITILGPADERSNHRHQRAHIVEMRGWTGKPGDDEQSVLADARLIAASPRLFDALKGMVGLIQLIQIREPDLLANHRYIEALAVITELEGAQ